MRIGDFNYSWRGTLNIRLPVFDGDLYLINNGNKIKVELKGYFIQCNIKSVSQNICVVAWDSVSGKNFIVPVCNSSVFEPLAFLKESECLSQYVYDSSVQLVDDYVLKSPTVTLRRFKAKNSKCSLSDFCKYELKRIDTYRRVTYNGNIENVYKHIWLDKNCNSYREDYCYISKRNFNIIDMRSVALC